MNADPASAFGAGPSCVFISQKFTHSKIPDIRKIFDHTHIVSGTVPLIQMLQILAWEIVTLITKGNLPLLNDLAVSDLAPGDANGFIGIHYPASGTFVLFPQVSHANAAVHSTGANERNFI